MHVSKKKTKSEETGRMNHNHLESKLNSPRARVVCSLSKRGIPHGCSQHLLPEQPGPRSTLFISSLMHPHKITSKHSEWAKGMWDSLLSMNVFSELWKWFHLIVARRSAISYLLNALLKFRVCVFGTEGQGSWPSIVSLAWECLYEVSLRVRELH